MTMVKNYVNKSGTATLERPYYSPGLLLEDDDLTAAVAYTRNMTRLMFRSLFGCGVICGFDLTARLTCNRTRVDVTIPKGVALDCMGDPIEIPKPITVSWDFDCDPVPEWIWVTVCYRETCCRPKDTSCAAGDEGQKVQTRVKDGYEVRLYSSQPKCVCSCEAPPEDDKKRPGACCDDEPTSPPASVASPPLSNPGAVNPGRKTTDGAAADTKLKIPAECDCYASHFEGKCDCDGDCCCPCVLIGKVHTTEGPGAEPLGDKVDEPADLLVDRTWVRWIRPVLVGYIKCLQAAGVLPAHEAKA
jgi:hypothetical protein